jgi:hypothetical protein
MHKDLQGNVRNYPAIRAELFAQLRRIKPSSALGFLYYPCKVSLQDGAIVDRVYVAEAASYIRLWGVWPEDDAAKKWLSMENVTRIEESPSRLPLAFANQVYEAGESGMGYCCFALVLKDGRKLPYVTGNAVDFPNLPDGVSMNDVQGVVPHERHPEWLTSTNPNQTNAQYYWCLYSAPDPSISIPSPR